MFAASGARTALDLFTGTTRVAQEFKRRGGLVTDGRLGPLLRGLRALLHRDRPRRGRPRRARRHARAAGRARRARPATSPRRSALVPLPAAGERRAGRRDPRRDRGRAPRLAALPGAADEPDRGRGPGGLHRRGPDGVPQAVGAPGAQPADPARARAARRAPGTARRGDAVELAGTLGSFDLAYLDPPYNQHRYFTNYHVWETLVAGDEPEHYGIACKRDRRSRRRDEERVQPQARDAGRAARRASRPSTRGS